MSAVALLLFIKYFVSHAFSLIFFLMALTSFLKDKDMAMGALWLLTATAIFAIETIAFGRIKVRQLPQHPKQVGETVTDGDRTETGISVDKDQKDIATLKESKTVEGRITRLDLALRKKELMPKICPALTRMSSVS